MSSLAPPDAHPLSPAAVAPRPALGLAAYLTYVATIFVIGLVLRERPTGSRWLLVIPLLMLLGCIAGAVDAPWGNWDTGVVVLLAIGTMFVGFGEEMATRGLLLVGLRGRFKEVWVWLITSALFALMHGLNFLMGQDLGPTLGQVGHHRTARRVPRRRQPPARRDHGRGARHALRHAQPRPQRRGTDGRTARHRTSSSFTEPGRTGLAGVA